MNARYFAFFLASLSLIACEPAVTKFEPPVTPTAAVDNAAAEEEARAQLDILRGPRCRPSTDSRHMVLTYLMSVENEFVASPLDPPERRGWLIYRLAKEYAKLVCVVRRDAHESVARGDTAAVAKLAKMEVLAIKSALKYNSLLISTGHVVCGPQSSRPSEPNCTDEILYAIARGFERLGDYENARRAYFEIIAEHPRSFFVPYAYFAFGELFREEAFHDPSKWKLVEQSFDEVIKYPAAGCDVHGFALLRLGEAYARTNQKEKADLTFQRLALVAEVDPEGPNAIAFRFAPKKYMPASGHSNGRAEVEAKCEKGEAESCVKLGDLLWDVGLSTDRERMVGAYVKACDAGHAPSCDEALLHEVNMSDVDKVRLLAKACGGGMVADCSHLGLHAIDGRGMPIDIAQASALFMKACDGGFIPGCFLGGKLLAVGIGVAKDEARAASYFAKACDDGIVSSCVNLGHLVEEGRGVAKDEKRAFTLYKDGCVGKQTIGCTSLGRLLETSTTLVTDEGGAAAVYEKACKDSDEVGCFRLGVLFEQGREVVKNEARAAVLYEKACSLNSGPSCRAYALLFEEGRGVGKDTARATVFYTRACDAGDARSCYQIGRSFPKGQDAEKAALSITKKCDEGDPKSCFDLGLMFDSGFGVAVDEVKATILLEKACDKGHIRSCYVQGFRFDHSRGLMGIGMGRVASLYTKACDGGEMLGCHQLGFKYALGFVVEKDVVRAVALFGKACDGGIGAACVQAGEMLQKGEGVSLDPVTARAKFERGCMLGESIACAKK